MNKFHETGEWERAIEMGLLVEIPATVGAHRLQYRTAMTAAAWHQCIASETRTEQVGQLNQLLSHIDYLLDAHPGETQFEFSDFFLFPSNGVRFNLFFSLNAHSHCVATIALADSN